MQAFEARFDARANLVAGNNVSDQAYVNQLTQFTIQGLRLRVGPQHESTCKSFGQGAMVLV